MADGGEDGVGGVTGATVEVAAAEMALGFYVADDGLDVERRRSSGLMTRKLRAFVPRSDTARVIRVMST